MCGIVGIWRRGGGIDVGDLEAATDIMRKRGPDDSGTWVGGPVGLGHRRLSILDLSSAGHQPMSFLDRYQIVFNGEIYNFREIRRELEREAPIAWRSSGDTETILAAYHRWGADCLSRFHGMFAFAIWDVTRRRLFVARDRVGEKPLYYHQSESQFIFASRPAAIFRLDAKLSNEFDEGSIRIYLEAGYVPAPASIYREVKKLPAGHYLILNEFGHTAIHRYWDYRQIRSEPTWIGRREEDLLDELDELVTRCVRLRTVSDAPVGAFLSGGIDSSLVVAKMARYSTHPPVSLTIGFEEKDFDESDSAEAVAQHLGTKHYCERLRSDDLLDLIPTYFEAFDDPCFDYSSFPTMAVARLARRHVAVSLCGDGGDELFGGYHYYRIVENLGLLEKLPDLVLSGVASALESIPSNSPKLLGGALRRHGGPEAFAFVRSVAKDFGLPLPQHIERRTSSLGQHFGAECVYHPAGCSPAETAMRLDMQFILADDYLLKVDRSTMAFSLESREPLLDQDLIEWSMKLPLAWKLRGSRSKYLLRKLLYRYVPKHLVDRPKRGFSVPMAEWLRSPLRNWADERICDSSLFQRLPLIQENVKDLMELHCSRQRNVAPFLWAILVLLEHRRKLDE